MLHEGWEIITGIGRCKAIQGFQLQHRKKGGEVRKHAARAIIIKFVVGCCSGLEECKSEYQSDFITVS